MASARTTHIASDDLRIWRARLRELQDKLKTAQGAEKRKIGLELSEKLAHMAEMRTMFLKPMTNLHSLDKKHVLKNVKRLEQLRSTRLEKTREFLKLQNATKKLLLKARAKRSPWG